MADLDDEERSTYIVRVWGEGDNEDFWIDLEVMEETSFDGVQFPGLDLGNQALQTTLKLQKGAKDQDTRETTDVRVIMVPHDEKSYVNLKAIDYIEMQSKNDEKLERYFNNSAPKTTPEGGLVGNRSRQNVLIRLACNNIDDEFLEEDKDRGDRPQPPADPAEYLKAVKQSKDQAELWLDVRVIDNYSMERGSQIGAQRVKWHLEGTNPKASLALKMPGVAESPKDAKLFVTLDPYQTVVNFGPDGLAVEFGDKAGDPPKH